MTDGKEKKGSGLLLLVSKLKGWKGVVVREVKGDGGMFSPTFLDWAPPVVKCIQSDDL